MGLNEIVAKSCSAPHLKEHSSLLCNSSAVHVKQKKTKIQIQYQDQESTRIRIKICIA